MSQARLLRHSLKLHKAFGWEQGPSLRGLSLQSGLWSLACVGGGGCRGGDQPA